MVAGGQVGLSLDKHAPLAYSWSVVVVETKSFTVRIDDLLTAEEYRLLQLELVQQPAAGKVIPGTGGFGSCAGERSAERQARGCSGEYFWHAASETILMLFAYSKNEREDLTRAQRKTLRLVVEKEYP